MPPIYKISKLGLGNPLDEGPKVRTNQDTGNTVSREKDENMKDETVNKCKNDEINEYQRQDKKAEWKRYLTPNHVRSVVTITRRRKELVGEKVSKMIQNNIKIRRAETIVKGLLQDIMELKAMNDVIRKEYAEIYVELQRYESSVILAELMAVEESIGQDNSGSLR
ncbi:UNVERIFIED_CONTAM: hypothetical protein RMT77_019015 [Armadillidium vulgare]